ncbi:MAG: glycoside hydrolase [Sandaracinus sp.]|mgnify:CR=1 FL=1|nr:glycoside hydrolase [Sandaracinus sp.]
MRASLFALLLAIGAGCSDDPEDSDLVDAGSGADAAVEDSGTTPVDAATEDSGSADPDAGAMADAGEDIDGGTSSVSGEAAPVGDLPGWRQVFVDDFEEEIALGSFPADDEDQWGAYGYPNETGWTDTSDNGQYSPTRGLSVHDGVLDIHLFTDGDDAIVNAPYPKVEAPITAARFAVRFRADAVPGYKTAWLLWPDSETWPRDGEIDFPEGDLDGEIHGFMHRQDATSGGDQAWADTGATYTEWHTAVIEWVAGTSCRFIFDGEVVLDETERVPATPMHWILQTETQLTAEAPPTDADGHVEIDWAAVWVAE